MKHATNLVSVRIEWCRRQSAQARTEPEVDGWGAEADGLRDALMNSDHTDNYRQCPPEILRRYWASKMGQPCCKPHESSLCTLPLPELRNRILGEERTSLLGDER